MIEVNVDTSELSATLKRLEEFAANASPLMAQIAGVMFYAVQMNFHNGGRPTWAGLAPSTLENKRKQGYSSKPLLRTSRLFNSITEGYTETTAYVGTAVQYAPYHQFGAKISPHRIVPRDKKALAFGGKVVKAVNHPGATLPARPFLKLAPTDEAKIVGKVSDYLSKIVF